MAGGLVKAWIWTVGTVAAAVSASPAQAVTGQELLRQCEALKRGALVSGDTVQVAQGPGCRRVLVLHGGCPGPRRDRSGRGRSISDRLLCAARDDPDGACAGFHQVRSRASSGPRPPSYGPRYPGSEQSVPLSHAGPDRRRVAQGGLVEGP